jgi:hypothetical protein
MNIDYCETFINLKDLTKIFKEHFNCSLSFMLDKDKIQLEIYSIETCNRWYMFVEYQFDIDDVINKFKDTIVREALNL